MIRRVVFALTLVGMAAVRAEAQASHEATPPPEPVTPSAQVPVPVASKARPGVSDVPPPLPIPAVLPARAGHPRPAPGAADGRDVLASQGRFANPGGIGKFSEYYTPFTPMYGSPGPTSRVAGFGQGGGPSRVDQVEAFRVGQYRTQNIQNNINAYGRPVGFGIGYGYGYGLGGGRIGGYPR